MVCKIIGGTVKVVAFFWLITGFKTYTNCCDGVVNEILTNTGEIKRLFNIK